MFCVAPIVIFSSQFLPISLEKAAQRDRFTPPDMEPSHYVFPNQKGSAPLSNVVMLALLKRMKRRDITVHGFRSLFRDWAAEQTNFPREVAEAALAHAIESCVEAAYRRSDLFESDAFSWKNGRGIVSKRRPAARRWR
jgi:integrase